MRRRKRTTTVTFETERILLVGGEGHAGRCDACGTEAALVPLKDAARLAGVSELALYRLVEARSLHFSETADGRLLVCLNSLAQTPKG